MGYKLTTMDLDIEYKCDENQEISQLTSCLREHLKIGDPGLAIKSPS